MEKTVREFENDREENEIEWLFGDDEEEYEDKYSMCAHDLHEMRYGID